MALIKCKECGKDISETAENCPHCGDRTAYGCSVTGAKWSRAKQIIAVALFLTGLVLIAGNGFQLIALYRDWDNRGPIYDDYAFGSYCKEMGERETLSRATYGSIFLVVGFLGMCLSVSKIKEIAENWFEPKKQTEKATSIPVRQAKAAPASGWKCADCGEINEEHMNRCQYCGSTKDFSVSQKK